MKTSDELNELMAYATGTENYYRFGLINPILITDGVETFAKNAETVWFLNDFCIFMNKWINKNADEYLFSVELISKNDKGKIVIKDGEGNRLYSKNYDYTDCPEGNWKFFYDKESRVLMWHGEY